MHTMYSRRCSWMLWTLPTLRFPKRVKSKQPYCRRNSTQTRNTIIHTFLRKCHCPKASETWAQTAIEVADRADKVAEPLEG